MIAKIKPRIWRFLTLLFLIVTLITACQRIPNSAKIDLPPLRISYYLWSGLYPLAIAQEKGFFTQQGVNVQPIYTKKYFDTVAKFVGGELDGANVVLGSPIGSIGQIPDTRIVMTPNESAGADMILAQPTLKIAADLKGKRIGLKLGDRSELFVSQLLQQQGLTSNDVTLVSVEEEAVPSHLKSGDIQAGATWEPHASQALKAGAKTLFTSKQIPGLIVDAIIFRGKVLRDRSQQIQAFVRAWFQSLDYLNARPDESKSIIAKFFKIKPEEVTTKGVKLHTRQDNLKAFTPGNTTESLYHTAQLFADFYIQKGGLIKMPDIEKLIVPSFIQQLQRS